jgi:ATP-dependent exoDNAse (exonuclease V) beta subunit
VIELGDDGPPTPPTPPAPARGLGARAFTGEQAAAIARRDGPLLLSANAGSGKTSVLVERFVLSVVEDGLRPAQVLAITFTDKAAGELRARVRERLLELDRREDARDAEGAWVSTIHGFCARVLRANAVAAGLDPAFTVLDEAGARALRREAFDAALAGFLGNGDAEPRFDALDLAAAYTPDRLERMVVAAHEELRSRGATRPRLPRVDPGEQALQAARAELEAAARAAAADLAPARALASIDRARAAVGDCLELLERLAPGDDSPGAALDDLSFPAGRVAELATEPCRRYLAAVAAYRQAAVDAAAAPALELIGELLERFGAAYAQGKARRSALDFADLELVTRDLFAADPGLAAGYAQRFERVMVDEFQDTNPLQLELIEALDRDNVFVVGDELQSIYGFRHADVGVFRARRARLEESGHAARLATSFRARAELLDVINVAYGAGHGASYVPLRAGRDDPPAAGALVELLVTDQPAWDEEAPAELAAAVEEDLQAPRTSVAAEARLVAQRVRELVDAGACAARDVVILLRAVANMGVFERALEQEGLATLATAGRGWWGRQQVQDLTAYLGTLANPRDEGALLSVLASPLAGVSSDGLALLALAARESGTGLWEALESAFCREGGDRAGLAARLRPADRERLVAFGPRLAAERRRAPRLGLGELLERVVEDTGYDLHVLAQPAGLRRLANVHKLVRLAVAYEDRHGRDIRGFIDHAAAELEADAAEPDAPIDLGDQDAVRLMTIHAAKGLEFPVVVVAELGRRGNDQTPDLLVRGAKVGLRLVTVDGGRHKALAYERIRERLRDDEQAEERRVMHVAVTRAEERLVLSGAAALGDRWPRAGHGAPPIAWMGPELVPGVATALSEAEPVAEHVRGTAGARVRVALNAPATVGAVLRERARRPAATAPPAVPEAPAPPVPAGAPGDQLAFDLEPAGLRRPGPPAAAPVAAPVAEPLVLPAIGTLSYTRLASYAACPYRFYLQRVLGLPEQPLPPEPAAEAPAIDARVRGTLAHVLLEHLDLAAGAPPPARDEVAALGREHDVELGDDEVDDLLALVRAFAEGPLRARLAAAPWLRREHGFAFPLRPAPGAPPGAPAPLFTGFVDVVARQADGTFLVVDYKTDRVGDAPLEELADRSYAGQRRIYALAALREGAPAVEVAHLFLERPGEPVVARFTQADAGRLEAELRELAAGLLAGEYPVAATPHAGLCAGCPGRGGLCSWPTELTDRRLEEAATE